MYLPTKSIGKRQFGQRIVGHRANKVPSQLPKLYCDRMQIWLRGFMNKGRGRCLMVRPPGFEPGRLLARVKGDQKRGRLTSADHCCSRPRPG